MNRNESTSKDRLANAVIGTLKENKIGFTSQQIDTIGRDVVNTLTNTMWYLDPHLDKLKDRSISIPAMFRQLTGFRDFKKQHKKVPQVCNNFEDITCNTIHAILNPCQLDEDTH